MDQPQGTTPLAAEADDGPEPDLQSDPLLDQQISQLQTKVRRVEEENKQLQSQISQANASITDYITEMSTMLDANDQYIN